ncbi:UDP-N-acetylglucosamine 2-epimerase (non-hydrolyzing) [Pelomonas sp. SE-A7]|uniref:non-hydrolyzing UDP-N-acetylglucosamine 2-epimerase n=1 Tax=Pelomonas sp. SE-A7 TaxID=3054953 RepID=UPI00259D2C97|nr:UDP-N-acetylglucosamine 2-epimerase (non-hydrolyzing) [Pelomonas sp. SE-A7]MDM4764872.1 UDP-N-acetylglucosamine 2-epimerase (non-hydrolyzing) [Pelomonas sp. SE-A7]
MSEQQASRLTMAPVMCIVGARPNFMKMAPILRALAQHQPPIPALLVHTGQHYDTDMSKKLFVDLGLPTPDINLEVGSGSHAVQTAEVMKRFEPALDEHKPSCVLVVGDVNSTLACTLVAVKKDIPVAHVEAGLRSYDRKMPEEINRLLTDQVADRLYTTERSALANLVREGIAEERVVFAGNVMIDSLEASRPHARPPAETLAAHHLDPGLLQHPKGYAVVTLHRPSNVDTAESLTHLLEVLDTVSRDLPIVFAMHPRTRSNIEKFGLKGLLDPTRVAVLPPQGYLEMLGLMAGATLVLTDSGGLQEETTALGVPCLTARENTERPITVEQGTNTMVGLDREAILRGVAEILAGQGKRGRVPEYWDGHTAERIAADLWQWLARPRAQTTRLSRC